MKVLGEMLGLNELTIDSIEDVRKQIFGKEFVVDSSKLDNSVLSEIVVLGSVGAGLQRIADVPIYFADSIVRRAPSLQATRDSSEPAARMSRTTLASLGVEAGQKVRVSTGSGQAIVLATEDEGVAEGCVRLAGAHSLTAPLGALYGEVSVERL